MNGWHAWGRASLVILLSILWLFFLTETVRAWRCCYTNNPDYPELSCQWLCAGRIVLEQSCTTACKNPGIPCPEDPKTKVGGYGTCAWTVYNTCKNWCPFGPCKDGWKTRYCCDTQEDIPDMEVWKCDAAVAPTCDRPDRFEDPGIDCLDKEDQPARGLYGRYFEYAHGDSYPAGSLYECGPKPVPPFDSCGWWEGSWEGYFNAPAEDDYEFMLLAHPKVTVKLDVNGNGSFDTACREDGYRRGINYGDRYFFISSACGTQYRHRAMRIFLGDGTDPFPNSGENGRRCWEDFPNRIPCAVGFHCENADYNATKEDYKEDPSYQTPDSMRGTEECPVHTHFASASTGEKEWQQKGQQRIFFTRHLSAGSHKIYFYYLFNIGSTVNTTTHYLNLWYRVPARGTPDYPSSGGWINLTGKPVADCTEMSPCQSMGTIKARAVDLAAVPLTCSEITSSANWRDGTNFDLILGGVSQGVKTQSGGTYVSWNPLPGNYTLQPATSGGASIYACLTDSVGSHFGELSVSLDPQEAATFDVAYSPSGPWVQAGGGDVYAAGSLTSAISPLASPRRFLLDGSAGTPGVVTYGSSYDFDAGSGRGGSYVSSTNWLANSTYTAVDYYTYFWRRLGAPTTTDNDLFPTLLAVTQPASRQTPYYIVGDMMTSGNWSVGSGENTIFIIDGNLTLGGRINLTGTGFVAFIVKGNITVSNAVGTTAASVTPVVEGIYLTSPTGTFATGASTATATEHFVGRGIFVAGNFNLGRDLAVASPDQNGTTAAEYFIYNPQLLLTMPEAMKELPIVWQEVAP